jgi:hypothetical protein
MGVFAFAVVECFFIMGVFAFAFSLLLLSPQFTLECRAFGR